MREGLEQARKVKKRQAEDKLKGAFWKVENLEEKWEFKRTSQSCNFSFPPLGIKTNRNSHSKKSKNKSKIPSQERSPNIQFSPFSIPPTLLFP